MKWYMFKRILFSIFSLAVVVGVVMLLVYNLIARGVIFQEDGAYNKKKLNDRILYEYTQYQRYGYLEFDNYGTFLQTKFVKVTGEEEYASDAQYQLDLASFEDHRLENASVKAFVDGGGSLDDLEGYEAYLKELYVNKIGEAKVKTDPDYLVELNAFNDKRAENETVADYLAKGGSLDDEEAVKAYLAEKYAALGEDFEKDDAYKEDLEAFRDKRLDKPNIAAFIEQGGSFDDLEGFTEFLTEAHIKRIGEKNYLKDEGYITDLAAFSAYPDGCESVQEYLARDGSMDDFEGYQEYLKEKYIDIVGNRDYTKNPEYLEAKNAIFDPETYLDNPSVQEFIAESEAEGKEIKYVKPEVSSKSGKVKSGGNPLLLAVHERSVFARLWDYVKGLITVETTHDVEDPELPESERYIRVEKDYYSNFYAVVGSGTRHKYLLYVDGRFPWIHQNFIHLNLGTSHRIAKGNEITDHMNTHTGYQKTVHTKYPKDWVEGNDNWVDIALDFHTLRYNYGKLLDIDKEHYVDKYTQPSANIDGLSRIENSFVMGFIATIISYFLGVPIGILMALRKDKLADKLGNLYIIFIIAVPSLAYIYIVAAIGTKVFGLPYKMAMADPRILGYILPTISLSLPWIGGLMKWMRRFMIDQMNSDYVKFARSQGLSEREIFSKHISRNALIPIVHGIPGSILGCLTGAIITESVYSVEGVGKLLTDAISKHDNEVIVAMTVFYTTLSIISIILGDVLLAKYDPRISLNKSKGGGR